MCVSSGRMTNWYAYIERKNSSDVLGFHRDMQINFFSTTFSCAEWKRCVFDTPLAVHWRSYAIPRLAARMWIPCWDIPTKMRTRKWYSQEQRAAATRIAENKTKKKDAYLMWISGYPHTVLKWHILDSAHILGLYYSECIYYRYSDRRVHNVGDREKRFYGKEKVL